MTGARAIFVASAIILFTFGGAYLAWHFSGQQTPVANQAESEESKKDAGRAGGLAPASGKSRRLGRMNKLSTMAESVRPNIVTYKQGKPLWELSYDELHDHVDDLRALADTGWGQAVLPLVRLVSSCLGDKPFRTEAEVRDQARSMRSSRLENPSGRPDDVVQRHVAQVDDWLEYHLKYSSRRRTACAAVTAGDEERIIDWIELALEQAHPAFLAGYLRWDLLPEDDAWMVRHAERLADFNRRFEAAYLDGIHAGERSLLDLAWRLYATRTVVPEPDPFLAFALNHAAALDARDRAGVTRQYMDGFRLEAIGLDPSMIDDARAEGEKIYERCCADARMPR